MVLIREVPLIASCLPTYAGGVEKTLSEIKALREKQEKKQQKEARFAEVKKRVIISERINDNNKQTNSYYSIVDVISDLVQRLPEGEGGTLNR